MCLFYMFPELLLFDAFIDVLAFNVQVDTKLDILESESMCHLLHTTVLLDFFNIYG